MKKTTLYKRFLIGKCRFKIRKLEANNRTLIYSLSMVKENYRHIGIYKNPRDAINSAKEFSRLFD